MGRENLSGISKQNVMGGNKLPKRLDPAVHSEKTIFKEVCLENRSTDSNFQLCLLQRYGNKATRQGVNRSMGEQFVNLCDSLVINSPREFQAEEV